MRTSMLLRTIKTPRRKAAAAHSSGESFLAFSSRVLRSLVRRAWHHFPKNLPDVGVKMYATAHVSTLRWLRGPAKMPCARPMYAWEQISVRPHSDNGGEDVETRLPLAKFIPDISEFHPGDPVADSGPSRQVYPIVRTAKSVVP